MYNSYFGLLETPFSITPDPRFFYPNPVYLEAYATLLYGIEAKKGFVVVTGEVGTGKTTLLRKLLGNLDGTVHSVFVFNTYVSFPELLRVMLHDLGLTPKDTSKVTMFQTLNNYLLERLEQRHTVAVLVDEAQDLSEEVLEELRLLSNMETDQEKLLQIVLMGQPELGAKLDQPRLRQLKQRVAVRCRLNPLEDEEVGPYIDFRLRTAGYKGTSIFHPAAVQQIAVYSTIPRMVNIICDNALLLAFAESQKTVSAAMVQDVARNLRIEPAVEAAKAEPALMIPGSATGGRVAVRNAPTRTRNMVSAGFGSFLGILLLAAAFMILPQSLFSTAEKKTVVVKYNLNPEPGPKKVHAEPPPKREDRQIKIQYGATILEIASDTYGANPILGLDLIKEFNPQIENLNWVTAGQDLLLPYLTRETLLRQQSDGSYHIILDSFRTRAKADEYAGILNAKGYQTSVTPRPVSDSLVLYRVEIDGLENLEEANRIWQTGISNQWLAFADSVTK
ncbi:MAG: AAA family ATPase [Candidatus Binatia bacterium]